MTTQNLDLYTQFIFVVRFVACVSSATVAALLVRACIAGWSTMEPAAKTLGVALVIYGLNITGFVSLVIINTQPAVPGSLIYVGFNVVNALIFRTLYQADAAEKEKKRAG